MPSAARLGDMGSGHGAFPPTPVLSGSPDVSINGRSAARVGDALAPHAAPKHPPHGRSISAGSGSVSINGASAARVGDSIGCGGAVATGSGDVHIGDTGFGSAAKDCMDGARSSVSPFVNVVFETLRPPPLVRKAFEFAMAAAQGPEALTKRVRAEASAIVERSLREAGEAAPLFPSAAASLVQPMVQKTISQTAISEFIRTMEKVSQLGAFDQVSPNSLLKRIGSSVEKDLLVSLLAMADLKPNPRASKAPLLLKEAGKRFVENVIKERLEIIS